MTEWLLINLATFGYPLLFVTTFLSCLALPMPASLAMLSAGAFAASGDLLLWGTTAAALSGAILGDQAGFFLARYGSRRFAPAVTGNRARARLFAKARNLTHKYGGPGIFLSRWFVSPLGPYANFVSGATHYQWHRFFLWGAAGEVVWVMLYTGLGYFFASNIDMVAELASDASGLFAGIVLSLGIGVYLFQSIRRRPHE